MREDLYRGRRKDNGEWIYGSLLHQTDYYGDKCNKYFIIDGTSTQDYDIGYAYEVVSETVGQYTGWMFNGVKSFEGDILKSAYGLSIIKFGKGCYEGEDWVPSYDTIGMHIEYKQGEFVMPDADKMDYFYVVGNIYDNPELMKGKFNE